MLFTSVHVVRVFFLLITFSLISACGGGGGGELPEKRPYSVGGTVSGLQGNSITLQNNAEGDLFIDSDGAFTFANKVQDGELYAVTVKTQPENSDFVCTVSNASGLISGAPVTNVLVNCVDITANQGSLNFYSIGGEVVGLKGSGLVLVNHGSEVGIEGNGSFVFSSGFLNGSAYDISVKTHPSNPSQQCSLTNQTGVIASENISNVLVSCEDTGPGGNNYTVGGRISGLAGSALELQNQGGDDFVIENGSTSFVFPQTYTDGSPYEVTIKNHPTNLNQNCTITNNAGTIAASNVTDIAINCTTLSYQVGGQLVGLLGSGLKLRNSNNELISLNSNGSFLFGVSLLDGSDYTVTVAEQPTSPNQQCDLTNSTGTIAGVDVSNIELICNTETYTISGTVTGLVGTGFELNLNNNPANITSIASDGVFSFTRAIADGSPYEVTVETKPSQPSQTCEIANGTGTLTGRHITNVEISCSVDVFSVGGVVRGLAGQGLVLGINGGESLELTPPPGTVSDLPFNFPSGVTDLSAFEVNVVSSPTNPVQVCSVVENTGLGTIAGADYSGVEIECVTQSFSVSGVVRGLVGELVLQNNGGDDQTLNSSGEEVAFTFTTPLEDLSPYNVSVLSSTLSSCAVANGSGSLAGSHVTNVEVNCSINQFSIGGIVSGLHPGGELVLRNNGSDEVIVTGADSAADVSFTFPNLVDDLSRYDVTVVSSPSSPQQTCVVTEGATGVLATSNVDDIRVNCVTDQFTVSGTVVGLNGQLVLQNNGSDNLSITGSGDNVSFSFVTPLDDGSTYSVTVLTNPSSPNQTCLVSNGSGTLAAANVANVTVLCTTSRYFIGGSVSGLEGELVLQNNGGDNLTLTPEGPSFNFNFITRLDDTSDYNVTILSAPDSPLQTCTIDNASGTLAGEDITNIQIECVTEQFSVGGSVVGLQGQLVLQNRSVDDLVLNGAGGTLTFEFSEKLDHLEDYNVSVLSEPDSPFQSCTVTNGSGTLTAPANVTNVEIVCVTLTVGGTVSGLEGTGLQLQVNAGGEILPVASNGSFTFATALADGSAYDVTVVNAPSDPAQTCLVNNGTGTLAGAAVSNVQVTCSTDTFTVGGTVSGLEGTGLQLQVNAGGEILPVASDGSFSFVTALADGSGYDVTVVAQPSDPTQICSVENATGTVAGAPVTDVQVSCVSLIPTPPSLSGPAIELIFPTPGSDVGRGYATTTTVMLKGVDSEGNALDFNSVVANGVFLTETDVGSNIWHGQINVGTGDNALDIEANVVGESTPMNASYTFYNNGALSQPQGIVVDQASNRALVVDGAYDALLSVDLTTGQREVISDVAVGAGESLFWPRKLHLHSSASKLLVADRWGAGGDLFEIDLATGNRTLINNNSRAAEGVTLYPAGNQALIAGSVYSSIFAIDLATGERTTVASDSVGIGEPLGWPYDIAANATNDQYVVASQRPNALFSLDPATGDRTVIASDSVGSGSGGLGAPNAIVWQSNEDKIWVGDSFGVLDINLTTQVRNRLLLTDFEVTDLAFDSENNRLLLVDMANASIKAMDGVDNSQSEFVAGAIGNGQRFTWPRSVEYGAQCQCVYVGDQGEIIEVDLSGGDRKSIASGIVGSSVYDLFLDTDNNQLFALTLTALTKIDLDSGSLEVISSASVGTGPAFVTSSGLAVDVSAQTAWLASYDQSSIIQVDLVTGNRVTLSNASNGSGPNLSSAPLGVVLDASNGRLLVANGSSVIAVDLSTGNRSYFSNAGTAGPAIQGVRELALDEKRNRLLILTNGGSLNYPALLAVDLTTGERTLLSQAGAAGTGPTFRDTQGISVDVANERVFTVDSGDGTKALLSVSMPSGDRVIVSQ